VTIELGLRGIADMTVEKQDTALALGTGEVDFLSTSRLVQLMQQATMNALDGRLPEDAITAGLRVSIDHLRGSELGTMVEAVATLTRIEGRRLVFEAEATSATMVIGVGRIVRVQIDKEAFLQRSR